MSLYVVHVDRPSNQFKYRGDNSLDKIFRDIKDRNEMHQLRNTKTFSYETSTK